MRAAVKYLRVLIAPVDAEFYETFEQEARERLRGREEEDGPILACTLGLGLQIWTEDGMDAAFDGRSDRRDRRKPGAARLVERQREESLSRSALDLRSEPSGYPARQNKNNIRALLPLGKRQRKVRTQTTVSGEVIC